jgi:hypothetical protein
VVGDWGVVGAEEPAHNDESLKDGGLCVVRLPDRSTPLERRALISPAGEARLFGVA